MAIDKDKLKICIICDQTIKPKYLGVGDDGEDYFWYDGNNAQPTADGQCCDPCNQIVLADRITNLKMSLSKR